MILNFSFLLSAGACYASVVGWNVWQLSLLKREIQINLGTKPIVYHLIENLFIQKNICKMTTMSQEHSVLTTSCHLYFPCSQSNFPNLASHPPHQRQLQGTIFKLLPFSKHTPGFPISEIVFILFSLPRSLSHISPYRNSIHPTKFIAAQRSLSSGDLSKHHSWKYSPSFQLL